MAIRVIPAARHLLSGSSVKNRGKGREFPRDLTHAELRGLLAGPLAYGRSRWEYRGTRRLRGVQPVDPA